MLARSLALSLSGPGQQSESIRHELTAEDAELLGPLGSQGRVKGSTGARRIRLWGKQQRRR